MEHVGRVRSFGHEKAWQMRACASACADGAAMRRVWCALSSLRLARRIARRFYKHWTCDLNAGNAHTHDKNIHFIKSALYLPSPAPEKANHHLGIKETFFRCECAAVPLKIAHLPSHLSCFYISFCIGLDILIFSYTNSHKKRTMWHRRNSKSQSKDILKPWLHRNMHRQKKLTKEVIVLHYFCKYNQPCSKQKLCVWKGCAFSYIVIILVKCVLLHHHFDNRNQLF